jgi:hypothetical protein
MHPEFCKELVRRQLQEAIGCDGLFNERVVLEEAGYPRFFITFINHNNVARLIRFDCTNYDTQPIDVEPVHPQNREALRDDEWLQRNGGAFPNHPLLNKTYFLCLDGTRHFYTHPGHKPQVTGQRWEAIRQDLKIADLIRAIALRFASGEWA